MPRPIGTTVFQPTAISTTPLAAPRPSTTKKATKKRKVDFIDLTVESDSESTPASQYLTLWRHRVQLALPREAAPVLAAHLSSTLPAEGAAYLPVTATVSSVARWRARPTAYTLSCFLKQDGTHLLSATLPVDQDVRDLDQVLTRFQRGNRMQDAFLVSWSLLPTGGLAGGISHVTFELEVKRRDSCVVDWKAEKWLSSFLALTFDDMAVPLSLADVRAALDTPASAKGEIKARDFYLSVHVPPTTTVVPEAIQVSELTTTMFPFQMRTVNWMMEREGVTAESGSIEPLPVTPSLQSLCFEETTDYDGRRMWASIPLAITTTDRASLDHLIAASGIKGGILAEEMGLGKTVELISLLALHKRRIPAGGEVVQDPFSQATVRASASTLIICPPSIMQQWVNELELHAPGLRVLEYSGTRDLTQLVYQKKNGARGRISSTRYRELNIELQSIPNSDLIEYLLEYDIILSSYNVLANELHYAERPPDRSLRKAKRYERRSCPLVEIQWWRVCLDEAQMIESGVSNAAQVARLIPRVNAWAITGTPVQKSIEDLYGLLVFLRQHPWCGNKSTWEKLCFKKEWFGGVFQQLALRHTKDIVHEEIRLPKQHRTAISLGFSQVEEENYQRMFEQACEEIEVALDGSPLKGDWNPESEETRFRMRAWLGRLRQTCVHPQIGVFNRRALGTSAGSLRTVDEVLEAMITQNTNGVKQDQRMMFILIASRAQLILEARGQPQQAIDLLLEFLKPLDAAVDECRADVEAEVLRRAAEKEAMKERELAAEEPMDLPDTAEDEYTDQHDRIKETWEESDDEDEDFVEDGSANDLNKLKNRLRDIVEVQHIFHFYLGNAYYNLKVDIPEEDEEHQEDRLRLASLEDEHYNIAKKLRKELMSDSEKHVDKLITSIKKRADSQDFVDIPDVLIEDQKGGIESTSVMDDIQALAEKLNAQAEVLDEWREKLIQLLQMPLIDQDDAAEIEGDEFQESTEHQDEAFLYVALLRVVLADRREGLTGYTSGLQAAEIKSAEARLESQDEKHQSLFQDLKNQRDGVKPLNIEDDVVAGTNALPFSMRGLLAKLRHLANPFRDSSTAGSARARAEAGLVTQTLKLLTPLFADQEKALKGLQKEIDFLGNVFNARTEYYRQLQVVSDMVVQFDEAKALKANHVRSLDALHDKLANEAEALSRRVAKAKSKGRFLQHLAENQGESQRQCIICQDQVQLGVLTVCGHQFCKECMDAWYQSHPSCPMCKRPLRKVDLHPVTYMMQDIVVEKESRPVSDDTDQSKKQDGATGKGIEIYTGIDADTFKQIKKISLRESFGSKIDMIVRHLLWIRRTNGGKSVLFSQWKEVLDVLSRAMEANGIGYSSLEEKLGLNKFKTDEKIEVFLLHARSQSAGLTLVTASNVFLVEPLVNIGLEVQAIARVHRIGQRRETNVFLYVIGNTVEESVWRTSTKRRVEMLEEGGEGSPRKKRKIQEVTQAADRKGKRRARDVEVIDLEAEEELEVQLEFTNSLQLQEGAVGSMVERGQGGGEIVDPGQLWGCLFGVVRKDRGVEIESVRREQVVSAREEGRGNVVDDSGGGGAEPGPATLSLQVRARVVDDGLVSPYEGDCEEDL